ncbi:hypothetical protein L1887_59344 [Cichorium endivia]|nr:hypothetical protein L1887_59344 [Cichorium endivia]
MKKGGWVGSSCHHRNRRTASLGSTLTSRKKAQHAAERDAYSPLQQLSTRSTRLSRFARGGLCKIKHDHTSKARISLWRHSAPGNATDQAGTFRLLGGQTEG